MKNSASDVKDETLKSFKKARKKAKSAFKAKFKELKAMLKPYKRALKDAEKAEKAAKAAMKAIADKVQTGFETLFSTEPDPPKKRGRKPGTAAKAAKTPKAKPGRKPVAKAAKAASAGGDDLTQVKGVGENIAEMLKANGVSTFSDMAATSFDRYKELLKANGMSKFRDPSQWAARAAALANMPAPVSEPAAPSKRGRKPGTAAKAAKTPKAKPGRKPAAKAAKAASAGGDDLTQVKGVGENIAEMLKANGVSTFSDMAATSFDRYKELLKANGMSKFRDPSQWAARAAALANMPAPVSEPAAPSKRGRKPGTSAKAAKTPKAKPGRKPVAKAAKAASAGGDDLTQVKGVGENIAEMLKANGVSTFSDMAATSFDRYKELLKANGMSKFRDPSQWAARAAALANMPAAPAEAPKKRGRQPGFSPKGKAAAKNVSSESAASKKRGPKASASSKAASAPATAVATKAPAKPKGPPAKPDDLTQVKGVGQRVADTLNNEGIYTFKDMAAVSLERYREILKANNMSKFRDPSGWADMAAELAGKK